MSQIEQSTVIEGPVQNGQVKSWLTCSTTDLEEVNKHVRTHTDTDKHTHTKPKNETKTLIPSNSQPVSLFPFHSVTNEADLNKILQVMTVENSCLERQCGLDGSIPSSLVEAIL